MCVIAVCWERLVGSSEDEDVPTPKPHRSRTTDPLRKQEGYSGSDLKEMCRAAVMVPVRELVPYREDGSLTALDLEALDVGRCRKVKMRDFEAAMARVRTYVHE